MIYLASQHDNIMPLVAKGDISCRLKLGQAPVKKGIDVQFCNVRSGENELHGLPLPEKVVVTQLQIIFLPFLESEC